MFSQSVPMWLFLTTAFIGGVAILLHFSNPVAFLFQGHNCWAVKNEDAAKAVGTIFSELLGLKEKFTFDPGTTHQTLFEDGRTVLISHDNSMNGIKLPPNGRSFPVKDPNAVAQQAATILKRAGFTAEVITNHIPELEDNKFVIVTSNAFDGWILGLRRPLYAMGEKPELRKLLK